MAKMSLLTMTQKILSAMDSDEINTIEDSGNVEARQVVDIIEDTYYEFMNNHLDWNYLRKTKEILGLSDSAYPTTLQIPDSVVEIEKLRYDVSTVTATNLNYKTLTYVSPQDFLDKVLSRNSDESNVEQYDVKGTDTPVLVFNDAAPKFWTSFDETYITIDAYDSAVDSTLRGNKTLVYCVDIPTFNANSDEYVPECPIQVFPTLMAECKKACFFYLKQQQTPTDEKRALRGINKLKRKDYRAHERLHSRGYGRR
jgi:hypothetical protein